jgi:ABC-2 type transport system permease protein
VNIFRRELRANLKSLVIWCVIMFLLMVTGITKFAAYASNPDMLKVLDSMPAPVLDAMNLRAFNLTTVTGFFGIMFVYFGLMGAIAAAIWGSDMISKEERDKTVEFSLVLPVSRSTVITAKTLAAVVNCIVFVLFSWAVSLVMVPTYKPDQAFYNFLALEMQGMLAIELVFLAIGVLLGCVMKQYKRSGTVAIAVILVTYYLYIMSGLDTRLDFLKYFTPFKYFDAGAFLRNGGLDGLYLLLSAAIIVVCMAASYVVYNRRDLYI